MSLQEIFTACVQKCTNGNLNYLITHFDAIVKHCETQTPANKLIIYECIDQWLHQNPLPDSCAKQCLEDTLAQYKYLSLITEGVDRKTRQRQLKIQPLLDREADKQLGLLAQLQQQTNMSAKTFYNTDDVKKLFLEKYPQWLSDATCLEVAWNQLKEQVNSDLEDIPTHCNFLESQLMVENYHGLGRDNLVKALWRTIKTRFELVYHNNLETISPTTEPSWSEEVWERPFDVRNPETGERLYTRTRESRGLHADDTEAWGWRYEYSQNDYSENYLGADNPGGDDDGILAHGERITIIPDYLSTTFRNLLAELSSVVEVDLPAPQRQTYDDSHLYYAENDWTETMTELYNSLVNKLQLRDSQLFKNLAKRQEAEWPDIQELDSDVRHLLELEE